MTASAAFGSPHRHTLRVTLPSSVPAPPSPSKMRTVTWSSPGASEGADGRSKVGVVSTVRGSASTGPLAVTSVASIVAER